MRGMLTQFRIACIFEPRAKCRPRLAKLRPCDAAAIDPQPRRPNTTNHP